MIGIYGANGFIGRHLAARLVREGHDVRLVSRHIDRSLGTESRAKVDIVEADILDSLAMASSLSGVDTVIQLISTSSPALGNKHIVSDIKFNLIPHIDFIETCVDFGVNKYIFISSGGAVYGHADYIPISEDCPTNPLSSHGLTKLATEKYLQMMSALSSLNYVILRLANAYGPGQLFRKGQGLIPAALDYHSRGEPIQIVGKGQARRDYIYIDDVVDACLAATHSTAADNNILNIGSGESRSVIDVITEIETILGIEFRKEFVEERNTDVLINELDISKANRLLQWRPRVGFREGLKLTLRSYK